MIDLVVLYGSFFYLTWIKHLLAFLGSDHGIKAHGDGWLLTVALIEGTCIRAAGSSDLYDIYVVFTCNAKRKTSSTKFQTPDPKWNG
jgi:hypothetical protein